MTSRMSKGSDKMEVCLDLLDALYALTFYIFG